MDTLMLIAGVLTQLIAVGQLLKRPVLSIDDAAALPMWMVKGMLFVVGGVTIATSCIGFRFWAKTRRFRTGCCYFCMLLIGLVLQVSLIYIAASEMRAFKDLAGGEVGVDKELVAIRREALAKVFESFASRYEKAKCQVVPDEERVFLLTDAMTGRRAASQATSQIQCGHATVECQDSMFFLSSSSLANYCVPISGSEKKYEEDCTSCQHNYYEWFINGTTYEAAHKGDLVEYWLTTADGFCRCYSKVTEVLAQHSWQILVGLSIWTGLHILLMVGIVYLMLTAKPRVTDEWDDEDDDVAHMSEMATIRR